MAEDAYAPTDLDAITTGLPFWKTHARLWSTLLIYATTMIGHLIAPPLVVLRPNVSLRQGLYPLLIWVGADHGPTEGFTKGPKHYINWF